MKPEQACAVGLAMLLAASSPAASARSPLADAAEKSDRAGIRTLLKQRVDVNAPQVDGIQRRSQMKLPNAQSATVPERKPGELVYALHGLTPEAIKLVEGKR